MRQLVIAPEVEQMLGPDVVATIRRQHSSDCYNCPACNVSGDPSAEDTTVVVLTTDSGGGYVRLAHARCTPSRVLRTDTTPQPLNGLDQDIDILAALIPDAGRPRPYMFVSARGGLMGLTDSGDSLDPWTAWLLEHGWQLQLDPAAPARAVHGGWRLWLDENEGGTLSAPGLGNLIDRLPDLPAGWREHALRSGRVTILAGRDLLHHEQTTPAQLSERVERSARAGRLVAGTVKAARGRAPDQPEPGSDAALAKEVADALTTALRSRAGGDGPLENIPDLLPLPDSLVLHQVLFHGHGERPTPMLVVDLGTDARTATAILDSLEQEGLPRYRGQFREMMGFAPESWHYILWASQILVIAARSASQAAQPGEDPRRKLLFRQLQSSPEWYAAVRERPHGDLLLFVFNTGPSPAASVTMEELIQASGDGQALAGALTGLPA